MSCTRVNGRSQKRHGKVVEVSGSLAASMMLPTELAVSESESTSDIFVCFFRVFLLLFFFGRMGEEEKKTNN